MFSAVMCLRAMTGRMSKKSFDGLRIRSGWQYEVENWFKDSIRIFLRVLSSVFSAQRFRNGLAPPLLIWKRNWCAAPGLCFGYLLRERNNEKYFCDIDP